jgi:molybdate transport system regulatory protein
MSNGIDIKLRIPYNGVYALGPGKADLLEAIMNSGSISAAAKSMGMSYKRAWDLVDTMNNSFKESLVATATGGSHGGGAQVTAFGKNVLAHYRHIQQLANEATRQEAQALCDLLR